LKNKTRKKLNMKNIKVLRGVIVAVFLLFSVSCGDDFLDEKPLSFLSPENTFVDAAGLKLRCKDPLEDYSVSGMVIPGR
jgi:hypothetical protein